MGYRSDSRGGSRGGRSGGYGGGRRGEFREFRERDSGSFERRRPEMHEITCDNCGKQCEVPFKPTSSKPVFCRDCFRKDGDSSSESRSNFGSRNKNTDSQSGISSEQFNQLNAKLDKILEFMANLEFVDEGEEPEDDEEVEDEDKEVEE